MALFPDPAGGSMEVANEQEARDRGWTESMGSFGVNSYSDSGGGGGGGAGPIGQNASMDSLRNFFSQTAGFSREELAEKARQFNANLAQIEQQWEREGKPRLDIDRDIAALRRQQVELEIGLATRAQNLAEAAQHAELTGMYRPLGYTPGSFVSDPQTGAVYAIDAQGYARYVPHPDYIPKGTVIGNAPGLTNLLGGVIGQEVQPLPQQTLQAEMQRRQAALAELTQRQQHGIAQGTLGLNYLTAASQLGGPADYFQSVDFLRGARQRGDVPLFLQSLRENTQLPGFSGAGLTPPEAQTAAGLQAKLTGGAPISGYNPDQALASIGSIFQRGATGLTPGSLERLDPNELALLSSGGRKLGYDSDAWLRAYGRAGIGQSAGAPL